MARGGRSVTRRIDRLARQAHAFHRFAHHPLCDRYASEVLRVGRRARVCRGCAYLYGGAAVGAAGGLLLRVPSEVATALLASALAWLWFAIRPRSTVGPGKLLRRAAPGVLLGWALGASVISEPGVGPLLSQVVALAALFAIARRYRQRGPDRALCLSCPEYSHVKTCRGFAPIVRRERAFMRVAARWLADAAHGPPTGARVHLPLTRGPDPAPLISYGSRGSPPAAPRDRNESLV